MLNATIVNLRRARLVLGWVTVRRTFISVCNHPTQPSILPGSVNE